ncbi:unnamed protein product [Closterium sp. Naga37s-1]|nr:unnamed protein product [Closterium sp. Naga37s-1]
MIRAPAPTPAPVAESQRSFNERIRAESIASACAQPCGNAGHWDSFSSLRQSPCNVFNPSHHPAFIASSFHAQRAFLEGTPPCSREHSLSGEARLVLFLSTQTLQDPFTKHCRGGGTSLHVRVHCIKQPGGVPWPEHFLSIAQRLSLKYQQPATLFILSPPLHFM